MASNFRNAEKYYDPTAGAALTNIEKGERMEYKVGDIISAVRQGSPLEKRLIVLANDGYVLTGCILLAKEMANCVPVMCNVEMYANPYRLEHISFGTNDIKLIRVATDEELIAVKEAVRTALGFECSNEDDSDHEDDISELSDLAEAQAKELIEANARADIYKELYENLLTRCLKTA